MFVGVSPSPASMPGVAARQRSPSYLERVTDVQKRWKDKVEETKPATLQAPEDDEACESCTI